MGNAIVTKTLIFYSVLPNLDKWSLSITLAISSVSGESGDKPRAVTIALASANASVIVDLSSGGN